jgi:hypothetical protein
MTKFNSDIDIDLADRDKLLSLIKHTTASIRKDKIRKHNTGIYVTDIPYDPIHDVSAVDYESAEERGYVKLDLLNVHVYNHVKSEVHLVELMREPDWTKLHDHNFVAKLVHLSNHYNSIRKMPEPINSIPRLAMFLAIIRPSKKHLIGLPWKEVAKTVWEKDLNGYTFKRSHSCAYAQLVVVHMNLLTENKNGIQITT